MRIKRCNAREAPEPKAAAGELGARSRPVVVHHGGMHVREGVSGRSSAKVLVTAYLQGLAPSGHLYFIFLYFSVLLNFYHERVWFL